MATPGEDCAQAFAAGDMPAVVAHLPHYPPAGRLDAVTQKKIGQAASADVHEAEHRVNVVFSGVNIAT
jgi:hypothetical protein